LLQQALARLVEVELLYQQGMPPQAMYVFKHALIQETAYQSLLKSTRQQVHQRIAQVLEAQFLETVETQPELLAHHYTEAGLSEHAVVWWQRAGEKASALSAYMEAIPHFKKGLEVLQALPESSARTAQEMALQVALSASLTESKSSTDAEVIQVYTRASELCQQVEVTPQLFPVLTRLRWFYTFWRDLQTAQKLAEQLLGLTQHAPNARRLQEAHWALGQLVCFRSELVPARIHMEQSISCYVPKPLSAQADRDASGSTHVASTLCATTCYGGNWTSVSTSSRTAAKPGALEGTICLSLPVCL
jgi:tetratricopeptide (TPR) repeat protein